METADSIYFYSVKDEYGYMSNFYKSAFVFNNIQFICSEQYFMYMKCKMFNDNNEELKNKILKETSVTNIKRLGRLVKNYNDKIWDENRYNIMKQGLLLKFTQNVNLKDKLLKTGKKILYEASKNDKLWGIGYYASDALKLNDTTKYGSNLLGKCLMEVRDELNNKS